MNNLVGDQPYTRPGLIVLFGSGETSPMGRKIFEEIFRKLPSSPRLALLETPAGFELNSPQVIGRVGDFFTHRLQNFTPRVEIIPARNRSLEFSPDNATIVAPILTSDLIFLGPGSPSYAVRQLRDSLAWYYLLARHNLGAVLALASAATVAFSSFALPVYEIYKVGEELHWIEGLDLFKNYGLKLVFIPHWNNQEGGPGLDTSRCFMGQERFMRMIQMLPDEVTIVGLDEKTALIMDPSTCECRVRGMGKVTLIHTGDEHSRDHLIQPGGGVPLAGPDDDLLKINEQRMGRFRQYSDGQVFPIHEMGPFHVFQPEAAIPPALWLKVYQESRSAKQELAPVPPDEVNLLVLARQEARKENNWVLADDLRLQVKKLGWEILDTEMGPMASKVPG
jgi:cyanophycinase-like exopeptidase